MEQHAAAGGGEERDVIEVVNQLRTTLGASGSSLDVHLPQIVVIGSQSSGKSSVLENIAGREFLPRGSGVVTRRPTVVELIPSDHEYATFDHIRDRIFTDFDEVKEEIRAETLRDPGISGFSANPITIRIYAPNVLKLTLVDLPGIVRVSTGNQTEEAIGQVEAIARQYIQPEESLILAVSPANQDLALSDAIKFAREVDPKRLRTFGVLTKLDIMDEGTDAKDVLENNVIPLLRGYVGVINRTQKEIDEGRDFDYIMEKEKRFFRNHPSYRHLAERMGTRYLQRLLHKHLKAHIQASLPRLRNEISQRLRNYQTEQKELNQRMGAGPEGRRFYMLKLIQEFMKQMRRKILGQSEAIERRRMTEGALINFQMHTSIQRLLNLRLEPDATELAIIVVNLSGIRTSLAIPSNTAEAACSTLVELYKEPLEESVQVVKSILESAIVNAASVAERYPTFRNELEYRLRVCAEEAAENATDHLKSHIDAEKFYLNFNHSDFDSQTSDPVAPTAGPLKVWEESDQAVPDGADAGAVLVNKLVENEAIRRQVDYITAVLMKYLEILRKQVKDTAVKYIAYFLVNRVLTFMEDELIPCLLKSSNINSLMADCEDEYRRQEQLTVICDSLREALEAIQAF